MNALVDDKPAPRRTTSGKGPKRNPTQWSREVFQMCDDLDIFVSGSTNDKAPGKPYIMRLREVDVKTDQPTDGTAVLTLHASGSWVWGGDADVVAYVREPLDLHGVLP